jgi:hypothetical protein
MTRRRALTPLQGSVVQRLRAVGFTDLAEMANERWTFGESIDLVRPGTDDRRYQELVADLVRADAQATSEPA